MDVYFDDFRVTHEYGDIVAGGDHYPFGLTMDGRQVTREPYRYGYQGQFSEKDEETGWNSFQYRSFDPRIGRWLIKDFERQHFSPYLAMSNNPMHIDPNGLTDWRAAGEATLAIFGGIGETALGIGVIGGSGGLATLGGAYLIADGGTRAIMGIPKLISALTEEGNVSVQARANPTNLGGLAGQILDEKTGNKHNYSKVLSITNDFVSLGATGGSGGNFQRIFSNGTRNMDEVMAYFSQGAIFYDIFNNGGVIDMIENRPFNPREHCPDCIILNEIKISRTGN